MRCVQWGGGHEMSYVSWSLGVVGTRGTCYYIYIKVKHSVYRTGVAQRVPGG